MFHGFHKVVALSGFVRPGAGASEAEVGRIDNRMTSEKGSERALSSRRRYFVNNASRLSGRLRHGGNHDRDVLRRAT